MSDHASDRPVLRVVSGSPNAEELAAVIAVVTARRAPAQDQVRPWSLWARKSRQVRPAQRPGYGAWRASMMPR